MKIKIEIDEGPAKEVGGDLYDFFLIDEDHLGIVIADVSGKGVPAALFMMVSKALIKNTAMNGSRTGIPFLWRPVRRRDM